MKKYLVSCFIAIAICTSARAQVNTNTPVGNFFQNTLAWFSSPDTNLFTFQKTHEFDIYVGADYQSGVNISQHLGLSYDIFGPISVESITRNASVAGTIVGEQLSFGLNKVIYSIKATGYVGGGYDFFHKHMYGVLGARISKALTPNTFAYTFLEGQFFNAQPVTPTAGVGVGVTL